MIPGGFKTEVLLVIILQLNFYTKKSQSSFFLSLISAKNA